jgi:hypothetical protein
MNQNATSRKATLRRCASVNLEAVSARASGQSWEMSLAAGSTRVEGILTGAAVCGCLWGCCVRKDPRQALSFLVMARVGSATERAQ